MLIGQITISYTLKFPNYRNVHEKMDTNIFNTYKRKCTENKFVYNLYI